MRRQAPPGSGFLLSDDGVYDGPTTACRPRQSHAGERALYDQPDCDRGLHRVKNDPYSHSRNTMSKSESPSPRSAYSPTSTLTSLIVESEPDSHGFSDTLPDIGTTGHTDLNTTVVSDSKLLVPPSETGLDNALEDGQDLDNESEGRSTRKRTPPSNSASKFPASPDNDVEHSPLDNPPRQPHIRRRKHSHKRGHSYAGVNEHYPETYQARSGKLSRSHRRSTGDPRMNQVYICE